MYLYIKAVHIVFMVSWFAGLFYMPRLFIYHTEASKRPPPEASILGVQFLTMERRLWTIIVTPAMVLTLLTGASMVSINPSLLSASWMQVKLVFVGGVLVYHYRTSVIYSGLQKDIFTWTSYQLRLWNELATVLLVAIVFVVVLKDAVSWVYGLLGLLALAAFLTLAVRVYRQRRSK